MLKKITDIVRQAATLMVTEGFTINQKEGLANIVTSSDLAVQEFLCQELSRLIPGSRFFCEEDDLAGSPAAGGQAGRSAAGSGTGHSTSGTDARPAGTMVPEYIWIIDPIDGTANYSRGIDHCCISVALSRNGEVIAGVVYSPMRNEMYYAEKDHGAWCNGIPIKVSDRPFDNGILCSALCLYRKEHAQVCSDIIMETYMQCNDVRRFGAAALEICFLASGRCELYFEYRLLPWDFAAAMLILSEAGGILTGIDGTRLDTRINGESQQACLDGMSGRASKLFSPGIIVAANSPASHARLLQIVQKHIGRIDA